MIKGGAGPHFCIAAVIQTRCHCLHGTRLLHENQGIHIDPPLDDITIHKTPDIYHIHADLLASWGDNVWASDKNVGTDLRVCPNEMDPSKANRNDRFQRSLQMAFG